MSARDGVCGYRVWQEKHWPHQWIGQCQYRACVGGIRCNDKARAEAFVTSVSCVGVRATTARSLEA